MLTNQSSSITLTNVTRTNSGSYLVLITNIAGSITSSPAILTVHVPQQLRQPTFRPGVGFTLLSGDEDGGALSSNNLDSLHFQASSNLIDWVTIPAAVTLSNGVLVIQDTNAAACPNRFYRVIEDW